MPDCFTVGVHVGGDLPESLIEEFCEAVNSSELMWDWNVAVSPKELGTVTGNAPIELGNPDCAWGDVDGFLEWCQDHNLAYRYTMDPKYECDGEIRQWMPGWDNVRCLSGDADGNAHMTLDDLTSAQEAGRTLSDVIQALTLPDLPDFRIVEG